MKLRCFLDILIRNPGNLTIMLVFEKSSNATGSRNSKENKLQNRTEDMREMSVCNIHIPESDKILYPSKINEYHLKQEIIGLLFNR